MTEEPTDWVITVDMAASEEQADALMDAVAELVYGTFGHVAAAVSMVPSRPLKESP